MGDPYVDPKTGVMINKFGISDAEILEIKETSEARFLEPSVVMKMSTRKDPLDLNDWQFIHKELFQSVYNWAGEIRTVDIAKTAHFHPCSLVHRAAEYTFNELKKENYLRELDDKTKFCDRAAFHFSEANVIHPFREGNGRSQRVLFREIFKRAGWEIEFGKMSRKEYTDAIIHAFHDDHAPLAQLFEKNCISLITEKNRTRNITCR